MLLNEFVSLSQQMQISRFPKAIQQTLKNSNQHLKKYNMPKFMVNSTGALSKFLVTNKLSHV